MSITFPCPECKGSITADMKSCIHCGIELMPISIQSKPFASPDTYSYHSSYRPQSHSQQGYKKKPKANLLVGLLFMFLFGILSVVGYFIIATDPENAVKKIIGSFLIIISVIINIIVFVL